MIGSLFTGYGGLDMAAQAVFGMPLAFVSDIEPGPIAVQAHRHPHVPNLGDVTAIDWAPWRGRIDVLTGGFPCTDVSVAGARAGLAGARSGLWYEMLRAITELHPTYVVIENVRGLLSATSVSDMEPCPWCVGDNEGSPLRALGAVLGGLADAGYDARWCGLRAADVGACHGRYRVFILAQARDADRVDSYRKRATGLARKAGPSAGLQVMPIPRASDAFGAGVHGDGGPDLRTVVSLLPTPRATDGAKGGPNQRGSSGDLMLPSAVHHNFGAHTAAVERHAAVLCLPTPTASSYGSNRSASPGAAVRPSLERLFAKPEFGKYTAAVELHAAVLGRPAPDPTEPAPRGGRRLSAKFVEWMMMLPEGHVTDVPGLSRSTQLRLLGNGVVPLQAEVALKTMSDPLRERPAMQCGGSSA